MGSTLSLICSAGRKLLPPFQVRHSTLARYVIVPALLVFGALSTGAKTLVFPPYGHSYGIRKATPQHLFMFFGPRTFFDNPQGLATARLDAWDDSSTEKDDDEVVVYGVNSNRHQIIFNTSMWTLGLYGKEGSGVDCFRFPCGIAADRHGNVVVADSGNNRVVWLKNPKSALKWVSSFDATATGTPLKGPSRVGIDEQGVAYITDPGNRRIVTCTSDGKSVATIKCDDVPTALAVADGDAFWSFYRDERALFFVIGKNRIVKSDFSGKRLASASLPSGYQASYGAIDYYHNYWITDSEKHVILKFDHNLSLLEVFGAFGSGDNEFVEPRGIAIYKRYGQVFIAEKKGAQYYWIGSDVTAATLSKAPQEGRYTLTVSASEYSFVSLFSLQGDDTVFYTRKHRVPAGNAKLTIDGKGQDLLRETMRLRFEPTYSSYTYYSWVLPVTPVK